MDFEHAVLLALAEGYKPKEIARMLKVRYEDVESALRSLEAKGFVKRRVEGFIFKREVFVLTREGFEKVKELKKELEKLSHEIREKPILINEFGYLIPLMVTLGLIDLAILEEFDEYDFIEDFDFDF